MPDGQVDGTMEQRGEHRLKEWIGAAEVLLLEGGDDATAERFAWLASGLLRRAPDRLWGLLREASKAELDSVPGIQALLERLATTLIAAGHLGEAGDLVTASGRWQMHLDGAVHRQLAQAQVRAGEGVRAEATLRALVKRDATDAETLRLLYRLLRDGGQAAEAHTALTRLVALEPSAATATFAYRERAKLGDSGGRAIRIALLSSYVLEPLIPFLDAECRSAGLAPSFYAAPFNQYTQETLNPGSGLYAFAPEIVLVALDLEDLFPAVRGVPSAGELALGREEIRGRVVTLVRELHARSSALIVVHELALTGRSPHGILDNRRGDGLGRWVEDVNRELAQELGGQGHTFLLPLRDVLQRAADRGQGRKRWHMARMRHGDGALHELARAAMRYIKPLKGLTRKCVVVDLDNTLWGGVVGEVGTDGIDLGPTAPGIEFVELQEALLNLTRRGILLAVCSKNNPEDVMPVLREHRSMVLREEHFSAMRINWRNKAENLAEIATELNIGLDALVFVDDNPVERELIRQLLPEVLTVELPRDASRYRETLEDLTDFELLALTREDELRVGQYQANRRRQALEQSSGSLDAYLGSLGIQAKIGLAAAHHVPRLVQMFNKTNQFNTTTRRYQTPDVERFLASPGHQVYVLDVADRFGDHGLVGTAVVREDGEAWVIDNVLLSCRAMGLSVETTILKQIAEAARGRGVARLVGEFVPTAKNAPSADFYSRHGFRPDGDGGGIQAWVIDPRTDCIESPAWIAVTVTGAKA
jgi:FkbH-like protein